MKPTEGIAMIVGFLMGFALSFLCLYGDLKKVENHPQPTKASCIELFQNLHY